MINSRNLFSITTLIIVLVVSACTGESNITPTATLRGAIVPTRIPTETPTVTSTPTYTATATSTLTDTPTMTLTSTAMATTTSTNTPTITASPSQTPSETSIPSDTPSDPPTDPPPPPTNDVQPQGTPQAIAYGEQADGEITLETVGYQYEFEASAGDAIDIQMIANDGTLDPLIILQNGAGDDIAENDDDPNNSGRDSFLRAFPIPADGTYTILATRFQQELGSTVGTFTLSLSLSTDRPSSTINDDDGILEYGDKATSFVTEDLFEVAYEFTATLGDVVDIQMVTTDESSTLDPFIVLQNDNGDTLAENDDDPQGIGRDAYLRAYEIPADGTYTILATRFQRDLGSTTGPFELTLLLFDPDKNVQSNIGTGELSYGDTIESEITRAMGSESHEFDAEEGDIVNISMQATSGTLDPLLIVLDEDGNEIVRNDDDEQGIGRDSFIREFEIPADGTYTIIVTRFQEDIGTTTGQFRLTLEKVVSEA